MQTTVLTIMWPHTVPCDAMSAHLLSPRSMATHRITGAEQVCHAPDSLYTYSPLTVVASPLAAVAVQAAQAELVGRPSFSVLCSSQHRANLLVSPIRTMQPR